jgi:hypothetical protein
MKSRDRKIEITGNNKEKQTTRTRIEKKGSRKKLTEKHSKKKGRTNKEKVQKIHDTLLNQLLCLQIGKSWSTLRGGKSEGKCKTVDNRNRNRSQFYQALPTVRMTTP